MAKIQAEFHIFVPLGGNQIVVRQEGINGSRSFTSLFEATRHLRDSSRGFVSIHDAETRAVNRIPLETRG